MPKIHSASLLVAAALAGCSTSQRAPTTAAVEANPRIVERDLSGRTPTPLNVHGLDRQSAMARARELAAASVADAERAREAEAGQPRVAAVRPLPSPVTAAVAAPTPSPTPAPAATGGQKWEVKVSDVRLANTFERWAKEAAESGREGVAYKILWDAEKHVLIDATPVYTGSFLDAVEAALSSPAIRRSSYPLEACLYENSPPLVRITKRGEQTDACPDVK